MGWTSFIEHAAPADHAVQVYAGLDELAASVGRFLDAGFRAGEPGLVIACAGHRPAFEAELEQLGHPVGTLEEQGRLTWHDADETLAALMDGDMPAAERFEEVVGGAVDDVARRFPDTTIRAFGEMVDLLARRSLDAAAIALEELWNGLAENRRFALLCAYELDVFDLETQRSALPEIFRVHNHPRPVADTARLATAVDHALTEAVGADAAAKIYLRVAEERPRSGLPRAQVVLAWLSERDPATATRVLTAARTRYAAVT
jgi:hypothetical protein